MIYKMSELKIDKGATSFSCEPKWKLILAKGSQVAGFFAYFFYLKKKSEKSASIEHLQLK